MVDFVMELPWPESLQSNAMVLWGGPPGGDTPAAGVWKIKQK